MNPQISIQRTSSLILAKILGPVTVPEQTSSRHLFTENRKKFTKEEAIKICQNVKDKNTNIVFKASPEDFWESNCVTYPVLESMPNNILISQEPVDTLHCVFDNDRWTAFCVGKKHAVFVRGFDTQHSDFWYFDERFLFDTVFL